ncbi:hypothetical protein LCGC14_2549470, partial [marine sediment metagenome]
MEAIVFLHHQHMWAWNIAIRVRSYEQDDKKIIVIGPHDRTKSLEQTIERWIKVNGIDEVAWIADLEPNKMVKAIRELMVENGVTKAAIISENVEHQAVADMLEIE